MTQAGAQTPDQVIRERPPEKSWRYFWEIIRYSFLAVLRHYIITYLYLWGISANWRVSVA